MQNPTNMEEFINAVQQDLTDSLERRYQGIRVEHAFIKKTQGESYHGMRFHLPESNVAPVMNIEPFYDQVSTTIPYKEVIEDMDYHAQEAIGNVPDISTERFADYEEMKKSLVMQAIPIKGNEEMLQTRPHLVMKDMAIIYRFVLSENERSTMSAVVSNDMLKNYGITAEELHADAAHAMKYEHPYEIRPLFDVLGAMSPDFSDNNQPDNMLYVATYPSPMYGAGAIGHPDFMEDAAVVMRGSFFILPSSIHEVLLLPDDGTVNYKELLSMVQNINAAMVSPEERLTDNVYHYDAQDHLFETAQDHAERVAEREHIKGSVLKDLADKQRQLAGKTAPVHNGRVMGGAVL